jgi:hypothetical protein
MPPFPNSCGEDRRPDLDYTGGTQKICKISNLYMVNAVGLLAVMCPARVAMPGPTPLPDDQATAILDRGACEAPLLMYGEAAGPPIKKSA